MKQIFLFFSFVLIFAIAPQSKVLAQNDCGDNARSYVNANISTNGIRAITGAKMNTALNKIIDAIICRDTLATILQDSVFVEIQEDSILSFTVFGQNFKDTIRITGGGGGTGWGLSGNSVGGFDYIGTNNLQDFRIKVNNVPQGLIDTDGDVYLYGIDTIDSFLEGVDYIMTWSPTGELRRISSDSIADITFRLTQNGLNYTGGNLELGGDIQHPTIINTSENITLFQNDPLSGMGFYPVNSLSDQWLLTTGSSDFRIATVNAFRDTTSGNESIGCAIDITDLSGSGKAKGFGNKYYPATNNYQSYWHYYNPSTSEQLYMELDDFTGFTITPNAGGLVDPYLGTSIFLVKNTSGNNVFSISPSGEIKVLLNAYDDDVDAGANGLTQGDLYETSATNTLGLPVGVIMRKQ